MRQPAEAPTTLPLTWREERPRGIERLTGFAEGVGGRRWLIGEQRRWWKRRSVVLHNAGTRWVRALAVDRPLRAICVNPDASVIAAGERFTVHFDGHQWVQRDAPTTFVHLWGTHRDCAYGLFDGGLFHFDGSAWMHVDLAAAEIPGLWAHGASGADGTSWVVGTYATHSCMARGKGTAWERDGCGSWYLYRVHVGPEIVATAGGDGLWQLADDGWRQVDEYGAGPGMPLCVTSHAGKPVVLACAFSFLFGKAWRHGSGAEQDVVFLFKDARWLRIEIPRRLRPTEGSHVSFRVLQSGAILGLSRAAIWESSPVW